MKRGAIVGLWAIAAAYACACGSEGVRHVDSRFATPEKTIETLLGTYGMAQASQAELDHWLENNQRYPLRDPATFRACFEDYQGTQDEGLAGFVVGALVRGRSDARVTIVRDVAHVATADRRVVMHDTESGWKISLRDSVPRDVQEQLREITRRAFEANQRAGRNE
jgi:hypothetical protein